jgi:hypothetical protein
LRHDEQRGKQAPFRRAPSGAAHAIRRQMLDVVGQLRMQKCARVCARDPYDAVLRQSCNCDVLRAVVVCVHRRIKF